MLKIKLSIFSFLTFLLVTEVTTAQINTNSPYSRYGFGDLERQGIGFTHAMGGAGIGMRLENKINYLNPASYTTQDSSSFIFDFGLSGNNTLYKNNTNSFRVNNASFSHLAVSFPITRNIFFSAGLVPYSKVGYNSVLRDNSLNKPSEQFVDQYFEGSGGLNRIYFGTGVKLKNLSLGVNAYYLSGALSFEKSYKFPNSSNYYETRISNKYNISDLYLGIGAQYTLNLGSKTTVVLGATFDNKSKLNGTRTLFSHNDYFVGSELYVQDTVAFEEADQSGIVLPSRLGLGASFNFGRKIIIGVDYTTQDWTKFEMAGSTDVLRKSSSINAGIQYTPNERALRGYLNHVNYRLGGYYTNTNLILKGVGIKDMGATVGIGLPFLRSGSMFHLSYQVGQRGTLNQGLIKETYQNVFMSITLYDIWFIKSKFD